MIYTYVCKPCSREYDVIKSYKELDRVEFCPNCDGVSTHVFKPSVKQLMKMGGMQESAEFNPGLGCVTRGKSHVKEICKKKGLEEIGNEKPETIHKHFDERRREKIDKAYDEADRGWVGDGSS